MLIMLIMFVMVCYLNKLNGVIFINNYYLF